MPTNWEQLANEYKREYKDYAPLGKYNVKVEKVTVTPTTTGSIRVVFEFQEGDQYKYPKSAAHWIPRNNINWTKWHHACLLQVLGVSKENAQKGIDSVEKDGVSTDQIVKGYQALYDRACSRHPEVEIEVREQRDYKTGEVKINDKNGEQWTESEFADRSVYSSNKPKTASEAVESVDDLGGEGISDDELDQIPF